MNEYNISPRAFYRIMKYYINEIQYLAKSLLQDYKISYINEIQYLTKSLLQDYEISYINDDITFNQEPFTGLLNVIYE